MGKERLGNADGWLLASGIGAIGYAGHILCVRAFSLSRVLATLIDAFWVGLQPVRRRRPSAHCEAPSHPHP